MKRGTRSAGFTIVETMVVLAVSGIIFVAVAIALAGKQNASKFSVSIENVRSQIQQVGTDVVNGYYPTANAFRCTGGGGLISLTTGSNEQGTNGDCVFLGKVMQFGVRNTDPQEFLTYSIAGLRDGADLSHAMPLAISPNVSRPSLPDVTDSGSLESGLTVAKMTYVDASSSGSIGAFAYLYAFPGTVTGGGYMNGPTQVDVYALPGTGFNKTQAANATTINNSLLNSAIKNPSGGIKICFKSGVSNDRWALVTIGGGNRQLAVELQVSSTLNCGI